MSRDWTPKEWDMVHKNDPSLIDSFNSITWVLADGAEVPLVSEEDIEFFRQYPKLNLIGREVLAMSKDLKPMLERMEGVLNGAESGTEFAEKVWLWYDGKLCPGHYMDDNNRAMCEVLRYGNLGNEPKP